MYSKCIDHYGVLTYIHTCWGEGEGVAKKRCQIRNAEWVGKVRIMIMGKGKGTRRRSSVAESVGQGLPAKPAVHSRWNLFKASCKL